MPVYTQQEAELILHGTIVRLLRCLALEADETVWRNTQGQTTGDAMSKVIFLLLIVVSNSAMAEWVELYAKGNYTLYVAPDSIRKENNKATMWYLADLHEADTTAYGRAYLSRKAQDEYDCKEEQSRTLYLSVHTGNMAAGDTVFVVSTPNISGKWIRVPPHSVARDMWKIACGKK